MVADIWIEKNTYDRQRWRVAHPESEQSIHPSPTGENALKCSLLDHRVQNRRTVSVWRALGMKVRARR